MSFLPPNWTQATAEELSRHVAVLQDKECEYAAILAQQNPDILITKLAIAQAELRRLRRCQDSQRDCYEAVAKEVADLKAAIDGPKTQLIAVQDAIRNLTSRPHTLAEQNYVKNKRNRFLTLPNELLIQIISEAQDWEWDSKLKRVPIELRIMLVCRDLGTLAPRTPSLWATIGLFASGKCKRFKLYLKRSESYALDVAIRVDSHQAYTLGKKVDAGYDRRFPVLTRHLHRLRSLRIASHSQPGLWVMSRPLHQQTAPNLLELDIDLEFSEMELEIEGWFSWSYLSHYFHKPQPASDPDNRKRHRRRAAEIAYTPFTDWDYLRLFQAAPKLKIANLKNTYFGPENSLVAHLDTLDLRYNAQYEVEDLMLFSGCETSLKRLVINKDAFGEPLVQNTPQNPIHLPALQSLVVAPPSRWRWCGFEISLSEQNVLDRLRAPAITTLGIDLRVEHPDDDYRSGLAAYLPSLAKWPDLAALNKLLLICQSPSGGMPESSDWAIDAPSPLWNVKKLFVVGDLRTEVLQCILSVVPATTHLTLAGSSLDVCALAELLSLPELRIKNVQLVDIPNVCWAGSQPVEVRIDSRSVPECISEFLGFQSYRTLLE